MSTTTTNTSEAFAEKQALFARKLGIAQSLFDTMAEMNDIDIQPYVSTMHGEVSRLVRRVVEDALRTYNLPFLGDVANSIVEHAYDSSVMDAARYVIERIFTDAFARFEEAQDGLREGWYTMDEHANVRTAYLDALVLLNSTFGRIGGK